MGFTFYPFSILCLLIRQFSPFIFEVIVDRYVYVTIFNCFVILFFPVFSYGLMVFFIGILRFLSLYLFVSTLYFYFVDTRRLLYNNTFLI